MSLRFAIRDKQQAPPLAACTVSRMPQCRPIRIARKNASCGFTADEISHGVEHQF
jgi:hypothetical protein